MPLPEACYSKWNPFWESNPMWIPLDTNFGGGSINRERTQARKIREEKFIINKNYLVLLLNYIRIIQAEDV